MADVEFKTSEVYHLTMNDPATYPARHLITLGAWHYLVEVYQNERGRLCMRISRVDVK
jgi:hypothetical protein